MPVLDQLGERYGKQGVFVLAMNVDGKESDYREFIQGNPYPHLHWARDGTGAIRSAYRVRGVPTTYIVDGEGIVRYAHVGYGSGMQETFAQEVEALLE